MRNRKTEAGTGKVTLHQKAWVTLGKVTLPCYPPIAMQKNIEMVLSFTQFRHLIISLGKLKTCKIRIKMVSSLL